MTSTTMNSFAAALLSTRAAHRFGPRIGDLLSLSHGYKARKFRIKQVAKGQITTDER